MSRNDTPDVYGVTRRVVVSTRYPEDRRKLLEAIQSRRGDGSLSDTVAHALDLLVGQHFPDDRAA